MDDHARVETTGFGKRAGGLGIAYGVGGGLTYLYFAVSSHTLSQEEYGRIVVLWTATFTIFSALCRPIEPLLSRSIADANARSESSRHALEVAVVIQVTLALAFTLLALAFRDPLQDGLFAGHSTLYWVFIATVLGFSAGFFARGYLAGNRLFGVFAALLLFEGATRLACALVVVLGIVQNHDLMAVAIAVAPLGSLVPVLIWRARHRSRRTSSALGTADARPTRHPVPRPRALLRGGAFTGGLIVILMSEQVLLNLGPLLVLREDGAAAAGFVFNVLMVAVAPLLLFQAVTASLLPHLTRLHSRGSTRAFQHPIRRTLIAIAVFAAVVTALVAATGPWLMQLAFGDNFTYDREGLVLVSIGMGFYLGASTLNQVALAVGQAGAAAARWAMGAAGFVLWNLTAPIEPVRAVEVGFAGMAVLLFALLFQLQRRPRGEPWSAPGN